MGSSVPTPGQIWAIEVELTPKTGVRTSRIMAGLSSWRLVRPGRVPRDPTLTNRPTPPPRSTARPEDIKAKIYAAFDIQVLYRAPIKQATIWATITPTTPGIITAPTTDPRTDHDTAYGNLPNAPIPP